MGFLITLVIAIVSTVASYFIQKALAPRVKGPREQEFQGPTATAGNPIPVWWGVAEVAPNSVWWGNLKKVKHKQWFYLISQQLMLGWGVVNEIIDISFADKSCRNWHLTGGGDPVIDGAITNAGTPEEFSINGNYNGRGGDGSNAMFGGDEQGGGVGADPTNSESDKGHVAMYWGFDDETAQPLDDYLSSADVYDEDCSRWPNIAYLRMGSSTGTPFYVAAQDGAPKPMKLLLRRTAWWDRMNTGANSPLGQTPTEATLGVDANPAEVLYDILTHKGYGIGRDPAQLDLDSFTACAETLREEEITDSKTGFGISVTLTRPTDAGQVIRDILRTIDATLCTNPVTGKLRLKLIRPDYDVDDLIHLNASNTSGVKYSPNTWKETINEVRVTYRRFINSDDKRGFVDDVITDQDLANYQATGRIRSLAVDLPYITDPDVAALAAARIRRAYSVPLARYSWNMNREGFALMQGDAVVAEELAFGVQDLVLRVTNINYGSLEDGQITVEGVQDVFSVTRPTYAAPTSGWTEPGSTSTDDSGSSSTPPDAEGVLWGQGFYS